MNRREAYKILTQKLSAVAERIRSGAAIQDAELESEVRGAGGIRYSIEMRVVGSKVMGTIHDNNAQRFELLEEAIEV
jgi:hypothetical protein